MKLNRLEMFLISYRFLMMKRGGWMRVCVGVDAGENTMRGEARQNFVGLYKIRITLTPHRVAYHPYWRQTGNRWQNICFLQSTNLCLSLLLNIHTNVSLFPLVHLVVTNFVCVSLFILSISSSIKEEGLR